jgi:hypothetical protein
MNPQQSDKRRSPLQVSSFRSLGGFTTPLCNGAVPDFSSKHRHDYGYGRDEGISAERARRLIDSFVELRILERSSVIFSLLLSRSTVREGSIFLRGAASAAFESRDSNSVEIVLSPPLHPSRLNGNFA